MESSASSQTENSGSPNWMTFRQGRDGTLTRVSEAPTAAQESCNSPLDSSPHSTDIWSTARALNVLREESYQYGGTAIIEKVLEDAARYLQEFGEIRSTAEFKRRFEENNRIAEREAAVGRREVLNSEIYREGERVIQQREANKLRTETRKTKKVKRG